MYKRQQPNCSKEIINVGGCKDYSINETNRILQSVINGGETIYLEKRHEVAIAHPTWEKSVRLLQYEDKTSLREGLTKMWEWAKKQPERVQQTWKQYEITKGIYEYWK